MVLFRVPFPAQVCRLVFAIQNENPDVTVQMYTDARAFFGQGGPHRMVMTLPPLIYQAPRRYARMLEFDESVLSMVLNYNELPR